MKPSSATRLATEVTFQDHHDLFVLKITTFRAPAIILNFTDKTGSIGGVLVSPGGKCISFFASLVPEHILEKLFGLSKNPIHELEVLPVLVAAMLWSVYLSKAQSDCLVY